MIRHLPTLPYKGLTIILNRPSRFDTKRLISGTAGDYFDKILTPFTRYNCEIRTIDCNEPFIEGTRTILLLGDESLHLYKPEAGLLTYRGSPLIFGNKVFIPSITPQDSMDRKNYENPQDEDESDEEKESEKDYQKTKRKNFKFWMRADIVKAVKICREGLRVYPEFKVRSAVAANNIIDCLSNNKGQYLVIDIETDANQNLTCFSFLFSKTKELSQELTYEIFVVPFKRYTAQLYYSNLDYCRIFKALTIAFRDNMVVGHNLSFDLFVLLFKYKINTPLAIFDTMICHHRCHPEVEKSLGHCVSFYTDLPYHKDEGVFDPKNYEQEQRLWLYNAKDVWTTFLVFCEQQKEIKKLGAESSVIQACATMRSILFMQYEGMLCDTKKLCELVDTADKRYEQCKRILKLLTKREINPRSSDQVGNYLYGVLKLPILATKAKKKESKTKKITGPTSEEILLKLYIKYPIPSLRVIIAARGEGKLASSLRKIKMWKGNRLTCAYILTGTNTFRLASRALLSFKVKKKV